MVSIKKLEKNNFYFKSFPAEVMMGPKFAIAKVSLSAGGSDRAQDGRRARPKLRGVTLVIFKKVENLQFL